MREACGVFGVYAEGLDVSQLIFDGLFALQHRGQESAGMAVSDSESIFVSKDMGLVTSAFDARKLASLQGSYGIGHVRYATQGDSTWQNAQPVYRSSGRAGFALGHNGNLTNVAALEAEEGMLAGTSPSDSDLIAELISKEFDGDDDAPPDALERALVKVLPRLQGAFSLTLLDAQHVIGVRDPNGYRPLCLGRLDREPASYVVASESPALDIVGATFIREIAPGEMVVIDDTGVRSLFPFDEVRVEPHLCIFEFVYFARPDSRLYGREVHAARRRMGAQLATESPVEADLVMGVPDSGVPAAEGYSEASGIAFGHGLVKNRYIARTFIAPTKQDRLDAVRRKFNPLPESITGKRLVVVDDSIVRGPTSMQLVKMLREAGAAEVHLRISSPPFAWPCFYGIDTPNREELLAAQIAPAEIADYLGADSVSYLSLDGLYAAIGVDHGFCTACLTGAYPTPVPLGEKLSLD